MAEFKGLTIKLDLDGSGVNRGLSDIAKNVKANTSLLREANKSLKLDPTNLDAVRQKFGALNQIIPQNREKLKSLQTELKTLEKLDGGTGQFRDKIAKVNAEILRTQSGLSRYQTQLNQLNKDYKIKVGADTSQVDVALRKTKSSFTETGQASVGFQSNLAGLSGAGKLAASVLGVGLGASLAFLGKELADASQGAIRFQKEFGAVRTLLPENSAVTSNFASAVKNVSNATGVATDKLSQGLYQALSAGVKVTEDAAIATKFLETSTKLSVGGFTNAETAVDTLTTVLNAYKLETQDATKISDQLIATQNLGKTTVGQLGATLGNVIPVAADAGVAFDQVGASIATLTAQGIKTEVATTALRNLLVELNDSSSKLGASFEKTSGKSFKQFIEEGGNVQQAIKLVKDEAEKTKTPIGSIVGKETIAAFNTLASSTSEFDKNLAGVRDSAGLTEKNFKIATDNMSDQWNIFTNNIKNGVAQDLEPQLNHFTDLLKKANSGKLDFAKDVGNPFWKASGLDTYGKLLNGTLKAEEDARIQREKNNELQLQSEKDLQSGLNDLRQENLNLNIQREKQYNRNVETGTETNLTTIQDGLMQENAMLDASYISKEEKRAQEEQKQSDHLGRIKDGFIIGWSAVSNWWNTWWAETTVLGVQKLMEWQNLFSSNLEGIKNWWTTKWSDISNWWSGWSSQLSSNASNFMSNLSNNFNSSLEGIKNWWTSKFNEMSNFWSSWSGSFRSGVSNFWGGISSFWNDRVSSLKNSFSNIDWSSIGSNIVNGIVGGLNSAGGYLRDQMSNLANSALNTAKSALGIHSPSRVFANVVGKQIPAGIAVGIQANAAQALNSIGALSGNMVDTASFDYNLNKASTAGIFAKNNPILSNTQTTTNQNQNINITLGNITLGGGATKQDVDSLVRIISEQLGRELKGVY